MNEDLVRAAEKFINWEAIVLAFLFPLFFLPVTAEFFEFNKLALLTVAIILGYLAWGIKILAIGRLELRHAPLNLPVLIFWLATLITSLLSEHQPSSLLGQYGRWYPSLATVTLFALLYYLLVTNLQKPSIRRLSHSLLASATVGALLFLPQYFGLNLFGQSWSSDLSFTPLGSAVTLAILLGGAISVAIKELILATAIPRSNPRRTLFILLALLVTALMIATLILLNVPAGWLALIAATAATLPTVKWPALRQSWLHLAVLLIFGVLFGTFACLFLKTYRTAFSQEPHSLILDLRTSWSISATSFRQRPIWGSGPSTFSIDFTHYKPLRFNYTSQWASRFDKPLSEYLVTFAETGLLGTAALLVLIIAFTWEGSKATEKRLLPIGFGILAGYLVTYATVTSTFLLFLALISTIEFADRPKSKEGKGGSQRGIAFISLPVILLTALLGFGFYRSFAAEVRLHQALTSARGGELPTAYNYLLEAIELFPQRDYYHTSLASVSFTWANNLAGTETPDEDTANNIQLLISQMVQEAKRATELAPLNAANWEFLAQTYRSLSGLVDGAADSTINAYRNAINLDIFNPTLRVSLGGTYYQQQNYDQAIEQFRAAINLKNDYPNAYYNLGVVYKEKGEISLAITNIETALNLSPKNATGYEEAKALLDELKAQQAHQ